MSQAIEAAVFRRLIEHLGERTDVQNIDLMLLAGFCRNCLSEWYRHEASARGSDIDIDTAKRRIYGMRYAEWKDKYQQPVPRKKLAEFEAQQAARQSQNGERYEKTGGSD